LNYLKGQINVMKTEIKYFLIFCYFTVLITVVKAQAPSADCSTAGAQQFTVGTTVAFNVSATLGSPALATCTGGTGNDGWCWFTATGDKTTIKYVPSSGDPMIFVFSGPCPGTQAGCIDAGGTGSTEILNINTVIGANYAVRIVNWNAGAMNGSLTILSSTDNCASAQILTQSSSCTMTNGTIGAATQSVAPCAGGGTVADVWYQFVATGTIATISAVGGFNIVLQMFSDCGGTSLYCQNANGSGLAETINATGLTIGATYYVRVYQFGGGSPADPSFAISLPATISTFPYTQDFETGSPLPCGWISTGAGTVRWAQNTWSGSAWSNSGSDGAPITLDGMPTPATAAGTKGPTSGTHCIWLNENGIGANETEYLVSPVFDFTSITSIGGRPNLRFYYACGGTTAPTLSIQGSADGGATWGSDWPTGYIQCLTNSGSFGGGTTEWLLENIPVPDAYQGSNVKIRIKTVTSYVQPDLWIDDIVVENIGCSFDCVSAPLLPTGWTIAGSGWTNSIYDGTVHGNNYLPPSAKNIMVTSSFGEIWLFSPGLPLTGGVSYSFQFAYGMDPGSTGDLEVKYGTSASIGGMTAGTTIFSDASISGTVMSCRLGTVTFTPASGGIYYIGWQAKTISGGGNLYLDNVSSKDIYSLPVELASFITECNIDGSVELKWTTASETNNDYFTIERSSDAKSFEIVSTINGAGNSNNELKYHFIDEKPLGGALYYKLKQTDYDGKFEYFGPVVVNCNDKNINENEISIYPNPATNKCFIEFENLKDAELTVQLMNAVGQIMINKTIEVTTSQQASAIDVSDFPEGIYFVLIKSADNTVNSTMKFVKQ
jgi:hypothetical protein